LYYGLFAFLALKIKKIKALSNMHI